MNLSNNSGLEAFTKRMAELVIELKNKQGTERQEVQQMIKNMLEESYIPREAVAKALEDFKLFFGIDVESFGAIPADTVAKKIDELKKELGLE